MATPGTDEIHGVVTAGVPDPVNCVVDPRQTFRIPLIVGVEGCGLIVTVEAAAVIHVLSDKLRTVKV